MLQNLSAVAQGAADVHKTVALAEFLLDFSDVPEGRAGDDAGAFQALGTSSIM